MINLKRLRLKKKLLQKDLANSIGIAPPYYSMIEGKKRTPSIRVAKKLGQILDFSWEDLFSEEKANNSFNFKAKRIEKDLTIDDISILTNISKADYIAIENGKKEPNNEELELLKSILNL